MNNKGQSILAAMIGLLLLTITMQAFMSMFAFAAKQQNAVNRKNTWTSTTSNLVQIVQNPTACSNSVVNGNIRMADNSVWLQVGSQLAPTMHVTNITLTRVGTPYATTVLTNCTERGNSSNWDCSGGQATINTQQATLLVTAADTKRIYTASYLINLALDNHNNVTGCLL